MTLLDHVMQYHRRGWNVLPIAAGTKRPPAGCTWRQWQGTGQTEQDVRRLFAGDVGVGVILGEASGNLYVRDFDVEAAYQQWTTIYPQWAGVLPTAATRRGAHVYFTSTNRLRTRKFDDGELRGNGSYVVAPPTRHPDGGYYQWRIPLGDAVPIVDPVQVGFIGETEKTNGSGCTECTEAVSLSALCSLSSLYNGKLEVERIAGMALPDSPHKNNRLLFHLARICKTISRHRGQPLSSAELLQVFNQWHRMAAKHLRTDQTRDAYYMEFLAGIHRAKYDIGNEPLAVAWQRAKQSPPSPAALQFDDPQVRLLVALCQELQRIAGSAPFYLSCRTVARLLKQEQHTTAANWLRGLELAKIIEVVVKGTPATNKATRFRYLPAIEAA